MKRRIVLSGVNFVEAGPLAIFKDALHALSSRNDAELEVIALVHRRELFDIPNIVYLDFPEVKGSWVKRLWFEYWHCKTLSSEMNADVWLCMHDITANVTAGVRAVYCHNPAPFYEISWRDVWLDPSFSLFHLLYSGMYGINIDQNDAVIVQQQWMRQQFETRYSPRRVIVAHPSIVTHQTPPNEKKHPDAAATTFFYPAYPRCFKGVELLLEAAEQLLHMQTKPFEIRLTIKGDENRYARWLFKRFGHLSCIRWLGAVSRERVQDIYLETDCMVFPSRLETWGLPLSEFERTGKPILAADLAYAHETLASYKFAQFFSTTDCQELVSQMSDFLAGKLVCRLPSKSAIAALLRLAGQSFSIFCWPCRRRKTSEKIAGICFESRPAWLFTIPRPKN